MLRGVGTYCIAELAVLVQIPDSSMHHCPHSSSRLCTRGHEAAIYRIRHIWRADIYHRTLRDAVYLYRQLRCSFALETEH